MQYTDHLNYLELAIEQSRLSFEQGNFPAGAIVVKDNKVLSKAISSPYPNLFHADSKAVTQAFEEFGPLDGASLYVGLENCLMCLSMAYWAGIHNVYFAIPKSHVSGNYYETHSDTSHLASEFNRSITLHHVSELEDKALDIVKEWEAKYLR